MILIINIDCQNVFFRSHGQKLNFSNRVLMLLLSLRFEHLFRNIDSGSMSSNTTVFFLHFIIIVVIA